MWRRSFLRRDLWISQVSQWLNKPIATSSNRLDVFRAFRGIIQSFAEAGNGAVEAVVKVHEGLGRPKLLTQLLACDGFAGALEQHGQNLKWLLLEFDLPALFPQFACTKIDLEGPKPN
jgi:hypothetical protein